MRSGAQSARDVAQVRAAHVGKRLGGAEDVAGSSKITGMNMDEWIL